MIAFEMPMLVNYVSQAEFPAFEESKFLSYFFAFSQMNISKYQDNNFDSIFSLAQCNPLKHLFCHILWPFSWGRRGSRLSMIGENHIFTSQRNKNSELNMLIIVCFWSFRKALLQARLMLTESVLWNSSIILHLANITKFDNVHSRFIEYYPIKYI